MSAGADTRVVVLDHHDSFTHNIAHALELAGARVRVVESDACDVGELLASPANGFVLSAGPCTPAEAEVSVALVRALPPRRPLLGICLGHQSIACAFGGRVVRSRRPLHGRTVAVRHDARGLFEGMPNPLSATRYNSLTVDVGSLADVLEPSAWDDNGELLALRHRELDIEGVQFHPESWLGDDCSAMFRRWLDRVRGCAALAARAG